MGQLSDQPTRVGVIGAGGAVGRMLTPALLAARLEVTAVARRATDLGGALGVRAIQADARDTGALIGALAGCVSVVDLAGGLDPEVARAVDEAAQAAGAGRIVRLTCLPSEPAGSLPAVPLTLAAAAPVIGVGSRSFEIMRRLVERAPFTPCPRRSRARCQPVAAADLVRCLVGLALEQGGGHRLAEIGGPDTLTQRDMLEELGRALGRRVRVVDVPADGLLATAVLRAACGLRGAEAREYLAGARVDRLARPGSLAGLAEPPTTPFASAVRGALAGSRRRIR
jgi:uncharacterized protein YbjT (DUF2867 family)